MRGRPAAMFQSVPWGWNLELAKPKAMPWISPPAAA